MKEAFNKILLILLMLLIVGALIFGGYQLYKKYKMDKLSNLADLYFTGLNDTQEIGKTISKIEYSKKCSYVIEYPEIGNKTIDKNISKIINKLKDSFLGEYGATDTDKLAKTEYYQYIGYETYLGPEDTMSLILFEAIEYKDENVISENVYTYNISLLTGEILKDSYIFKGKYKEKISSYLNNYLITNEKYKELLLTNYKEQLHKNIKYAITNKNIKVYFDKGQILPEYLNTIVIDIPYEEVKDNIEIDSTKKTKMPEINAGAKVEKAKYITENKNMYVKSIINVFESDNRNSNKLGELNKGETVKVLETGDTGWSKIEFDKKEAYVNTNFLFTTPIAMEGYKEVNETVYAISTVNIRKEASIKGELLGKLSFKASITRIGVGDGWSEVIYNGATAYISTSYLSTTQPNNHAVEIVVDPQRGIDPSKPMVALTFDDGPNPISTPRILNTLEKYNAVATFFDLGSLVYTYPKVVKREEALGCEVGSHTYSHYNLNKLSAEEIKIEMEKADKAFVSVLGHKPALLRPPYGNANATVKATIDYPLIDWDIDTLDWQSRNKDAILSEVHKYSDYNGRIILMHSIYGTTADAVEVLVPELISKGYQLVTVSELAKYKGATLETGKAYYNFR